MKKSLLTNIVALILLLGSFLLNDYPAKFAYAIGIFALSGALTNWLAIFMLFEKVPLLYGSGVIPRNFEKFKLGIKTMIMEQFFNSTNIQKVLAREHANLVNFDFTVLNSFFDYNAIFDRFKNVILESETGRAIKLFGGDKLIESFRADVIGNISSLVKEQLQRSDLKDKLLDIIGKRLGADLPKQVEFLVDQRLLELSPEKVKEIIQNMIRQHLGWLVVWGGLFGGIIGAVSVLIPILFL